MHGRANNWRMIQSAVRSGRHCFCACLLGCGAMRPYSLVGTLSTSLGVIRIETQDDFAPKAETSLGEVPLDAELIAILRGLRAPQPKAVYILAGDGSKPSAGWNDYRAEATFKRLASWLRSNGVQHAHAIAYASQGSWITGVSAGPPICSLSISSACRYCDHSAALRCTKGARYCRLGRYLRTMWSIST